MINNFKIIFAKQDTMLLGANLRNIKGGSLLLSCNEFIRMN